MRILQIGVVAADMDLPERILRDTRSLQQQLVQRLIVALRLGFDRLPAEIVDGGAEARLDLLRAMSSCLAMTSRSSDRPPSGGGGVCCAVAGPAANDVARARERTGGTRRAPAQTGLAIGFLLMFGVRSKVLRQVSRVEAASGHGRCAGLEEEIRRERRVDRRQSGLMQRRLVGRARREEIDRDGAMVAEREADLAIVVVRGRHRRGGRRRQNGDADGGVLAKRELHDDASRTGQPGPGSRRCPVSAATRRPIRSIATDQDHRRAAPRTRYYVPRTVRRIRRRIDRTDNGPHSRTGSANPFPQNEIWSYPESTEWEKVR